MKQRPERKYSLGFRSIPGACSGVSSQCSSSRSSHVGSHPTPASRNATRSRGKRGRMPPTVNAMIAIIWPTGGGEAWASGRGFQRAAPDGTRVEAGPLLARAAGEHDGLVDALEVHVLEPGLRVGHAGALEAVELGSPLGLLHADPGQVGELLLDALATRVPERLEPRRDPLVPVPEVAAVAVGIDHVVAEFAH